MAKSSERLKIAIIAPPWLKLFPGCFYGIELVVQNLASHLTELGHHVELFSVAGTQTKVTKLHWYHKEEQYRHIHRPYYESASILIAHIQYALNIIRNKGDFDIVHDHNSYLGTAILANARDIPPVLHTFHEPFTDSRMLGRGIPDNRLMFDQYRNLEGMYFNGVSKAQIKGAPAAVKKNMRGVVYNGVDLNDHIYNEKKDNYYVNIGSLTPEKGVDVAVKICYELGLNLKLAGTIGGGIGSPDQLKKELRKKARRESEDPYFRYFRQRVQSYLKPNQIEYLGTVSGIKKKRLYANAKAFLNPIDRDEPFGLSVVDALASGTPVVTYRRGAMPEIIKHGYNGFIADSYREFKQYVKRIDEIKPENCRKSVEERFSADVMADNYIDLYKRIIA
jgi:glycosyltransferase involved in cell wall biosynthesis